MSFLTGSAPKATFSTQPTVLPQQQDLLTVLQNLLGTGGPVTQAGAQVGGTSLAALEQQALGVPTGTTPQQTDVQNQSFNALSQGLNFKAPTVTAQQIDPTAAFTKGVVEPMTTDFLTRTLPSIAGQFGGSAGGAYGSGSALARGNAATDLERTLAQTGSQYALGAATANQQANLTAGVANQGAAINAQKDVLAALGLAPTVSTLPETTAGANIGLTAATFAPFQQILADLIAGGTSTTQQTLGVGSGGSTGLLGGLLGGVAGNTGFGSAVGNWLFSDRRVKEDIEEVGSVDGFPLYKFKYKGVPGRHIGLMAQDVEKRLPAAVREIAGVKAIDYAAILENAWREAA